MNNLPAAISFREGVIRTRSANKKLVNQRRKQIVDCATRLFFQKGYKGTSLREIARACELTTGALYHYIGSKEDILHLIIELSTVRRESLLKRYAEKHKFADCSEKLEKCIRKYFWTALEDSDVTLFYHREIRSFQKSDRDYLLHNQLQTMRFFESILNEGVKAEEFKDDVPITLLAHDILMMGQDYATRRWFLQKHYPLDEYSRLQSRLVLDSVRR